MRNDEGNLEFLVDNYSVASVRKRNYFGGVFNFYHRRFENIINISIKYVFKLKEIKEPYLTEKEFN